METRSRSDHEADIERFNRTGQEPAHWPPQVVDNLVIPTNYHFMTDAEVEKALAEPEAEADPDC